MTGSAGRTADQRKRNAGSPKSGEPAFLAVGKLRRPHGIHGEIVMEVLTDFPERLRTGRQVLIGESHLPVKIAGVRWHNQLMLICFDGYPDRTSVELFRNQLVVIPVQELPKLPEGQYYQHEIIGLRVVNQSGLEMGVVEQILVTGANDVYLVRGVDGGEILLPAIDEVIRSVDLTTKTMIVAPQEWI